MMSILSTTPETEVARRNKILSDMRESLTDSLTIESNGRYSSNNLATKVYDKKAELEIKRLERQDVDSLDYYDSLLDD